MSFIFLNKCIPLAKDSFNYIFHREFRQYYKSLVCLGLLNTHKIIRFSSNTEKKYLQIA